LIAVTIVCVAGLSVSYDKPVVVHEGEPPTSVHTTVAKLWMAALLHKEVQFCCLEDLLCRMTSRHDLCCFQDWWSTEFSVISGIQDSIVTGQWELSFDSWQG